MSPSDPLVEHGFAKERNRNRKLKVTLLSMALAVGVEVARAYGIELSAILAPLLMGGGAAYVGGEGLADFGKRAAEVRAKSNPQEPPSATP